MHVGQYFLPVENKIAMSYKPLAINENLVGLLGFEPRTPAL
ncbi:MAG: hypothetical protein UT66_C0054G0001 [candidate division CPR2 bacterium GW2011_GWC1_39_9]|uniref:Uncharacterized protein n=1 Tax=candidate division CPR2 bacterium GW2011_GWC2_39_10 TaxID=1618345 RepID=A0A0G0LT99_UNCC2|nr:MAG: hypothetical protein UT18_C0003G0007 [candidate division CPR2 bacterium GW2011_GWC2_39_10]KKR32794.1 MAG: hypothetical protein UT66_C0054G0001 [candidate division CPR2 bacterium GW2011_GWC1_39_9]